MKKLLLKLLSLSLVCLMACSKQELTPEKPDSKSLIKSEKIEEIELTGRNGWNAMNNFRASKNAYPAQAGSDMSVDLALWLMETTLNYDHGSLDRVLINKVVDTIDFSINRVSGQILAGNSIMDQYIQLETNINNLGGELILTDLQFVSFGASVANYRAVAIHGEGTSPASTIPPFANSYNPIQTSASCSNDGTAWQAITDRIVAPVNKTVTAGSGWENTNIYMYVSDFKEGITVTPESIHTSGSTYGDSERLWWGYYYTGEGGNCIQNNKMNELLTHATNTMNEYQATLTPPWMVAQVVMGTRIINPCNPDINCWKRAGHTEKIYIGKYYYGPILPGL